MASVEMVTVTVTTYTPESGSSNLQGYYILPDGTVTSKVCSDEEELIADDNFPFCCSTRSSGDCYQATMCSGNTMVDPDNDTWVCDNGAQCRPMTIYDSFERSRHAWSGIQYWCFQSWVPDAVYRTLPYTETISVSATTTGDAETTASATATTGNTSALPVETASGSSGSSTNTGAIAGGVVGGVAGAAFLAAAAFFVIRQRRKKREQLREIGLQYVEPRGKGK